MVAGKLVGATADGAVSLAGEIFGGLFGDRVREWRTRNLVASLSKTADFLRAKGVQLDRARVLPMGEAYAMFENASKQADPSITDLWAGLLANAMDPSSATTIEPAMVETLKSFGRYEAAVMEFLWQWYGINAELRGSLPKHPTIKGLATPEYKQELENYKAEVAEVNAAFKSRFVNLHTELVGRHEESHVEDAMVNLVRLQCIFQPLPRLEARHFVQRSAYVDPGVEPDRLADALDQITAAIEASMGAGIRPQKPRGQATVIDPVAPSYELTDHGFRLMEACH